MLIRNLAIPPLGNGAAWFRVGKVILTTVSAVVILVILTQVFGQWSLHPYAHHNLSPLLTELALGKVLADASPAFGNYIHVQSKTSTWMKEFADETPIAHMNIPGTHDAATWNYSLATQESLNHVTELARIAQIDPRAFRCQDRSMIDMLNAGIRAFDLRYAFDVTNSTLIFWHRTSLLSETATVENTLYGFYYWLDQHPSEAIFLSFQYEEPTTPYGANNADVQQKLYDILSSPAAQKYILQVWGTLGTLGEARGKITLLKRFDFDQLPPPYASLIPGLHMSPNNWIRNSPNITLIYNTTTGATAYIEDYYQPLTPSDSEYTQNIQWKLNATEAHLHMAATTHPDSLFWSFASSTKLMNSPPVTPRDQALGNGSPGVNQRLIPLFESMKGKRLGIVMFDFFDTPDDLIPLFLSLISPAKTSSYRF